MDTLNRRLKIVNNTKSWQVSQFLAAMGTGYFSLPDNSFIEKVGIPPKVLVPIGTNALDYIPKILGQ